MPAVEEPPADFDLNAVVTACHYNRFKYEAEYEGKLARVVIHNVLERDRLAGKPYMWVTTDSGLARLHVDEATARQFADYSMAKSAKKYEAVGRIDDVAAYGSGIFGVELRDVRVRENTKPATSVTPKTPRDSRAR